MKQPQALLEPELLAHYFTPSASERLGLFGVLKDSAVCHSGMTTLSRRV